MPFNLTRISGSSLLGLNANQIHMLVEGKTLRTGPLLGLNWNNLPGLGLKYYFGTNTLFKTSANYGLRISVNSSFFRE